MDGYGFYSSIMAADALLEPSLLRQYSDRLLNSGPLAHHLLPQSLSQKPSDWLAIKVNCLVNCDAYQYLSEAYLASFCERGTTRMVLPRSFDADSFLVCTNWQSCHCT